MTKYNTGNPVGSSSPLDLYDNAENLDAGINGPGGTWVDRKGQPRKSWAGIEVDFENFLADGSVITFSTWAEASAAAAAGQIPENRQVQILGDEGTHNDPVSGLVVSNSGRFVKVVAGLAWRSDDALAAKADQTELVKHKTNWPSHTPWRWERKSRSLGRPIALVRCGLMSCTTWKRETPW